MGDFSWKTADTQMPILVGEHRCVYLLQPHGKSPVPEPCYQGYGVFGGVDVFEWLIENNPDAYSTLLAALQKPFQGIQRKDGVLLDSIFHGRTPNPWGVVIDYPIKLSYDPNVVYETVGPSIEADDTDDHEVSVDLNIEKSHEAIKSGEDVTAYCVAIGPLGDEGILFRSQEQKAVSNDQ